MYKSTLIYNVDYYTLESFKRKLSVFFNTFYFLGEKQLWKFISQRVIFARKLKD